MKNFRRVTAILLASVLIAGMFLTSCIKKNETAEASEPAAESSVPVESSKEESSKAESSKAESSKAVESSKEESSQEESSQIPVPEGNMNLLTGLYNLSDEAVGKRPVAIMINNHFDSLPQYGIAGADVMMEMLVEHGITRMLAIFGDNTEIPNVCSVRSCRPYYAEFACGFDAIYVHVGGSKAGNAMIASLGLADFDGQKGDYNMFDRDPNRLPYYALEHTMYFKGENAWWEIPNYGYREELRETHATPWFNFRLPDDYQSNTTDKAEHIRIDFSEDYYYTDLEYHPEDHKYYKFHSGEIHYDQSTGEQLAYTNVLILQSDEYYSSDGYRHIDTMGGEGYYISNGTYEPIKWSRESEYDRIEVTSPDGKEITMNAGTFYIGVIDYETPLVIE
ncbi:MAG: DUF3048 domain-containing protein [Firmicutes bacterium]|nr:DUF3048 domain-containing protein [Bacillota bacterium]